MKSIRYEKDPDNIVHLILDRPQGSANLMDEQFSLDLQRAVQQLQEDKHKIGVILRSAKKTFFAGGDLDTLVAVTPETAGQLFAGAQATKTSMRHLETLGVPVVAAIAGAALGGGWELALSCHHRIAVNDNRIALGLPEVTLGLLPGGGGVVRMTRLLGLQAAMPYLAEGRQFKPQPGLDSGLLHELAEDEKDLLARAAAWIKANPEARQPWDQPGYKIPGGAPKQAAFAQMLPIVPAILKSKTKGVMPAPEAILSAAVEGLQVDFDTAIRIESRYFAELAAGQVAKNMIGTFWYQLNEIKAGASRPVDYEAQTVNKVGILGAGMMGAGIAHACATRGIDVVLKDVSVEQAETGKDYTAKLLDKRVARGRMTAAQRDQVLDRIKATGNAADLAGCELIIEAVFEDRALKAEVTAQAEAHLDAGAVFASNTSTLPITGLAEASARPANFIGLHFFSPVDKMPLVEIICGAKTDPATLAKAYDFVQQIAKTPIVVNDSRGFFTSRVFGTFTQEGIAMLSEGIAAASIENGAFLAGFPVGPLAVTDEVTLSLAAKVRNQTIKDLEAEGKSYRAHPADAVIDRLLEQDRTGKAAGKGFYEYPQQGKKFLWPGLQTQFYNADAQIPLQDIKDRLLFIQALESVRCLDEQVLTAVRDANIGSIFGIGYPPWTGGVIQFINQYGPREFVARARTLAQRYGERFTPPDSLIEKAEQGATYHDHDRDHD
ncbi:3-hydroxyacyl-CoA dehydrogenase [Exilibacterium tricleocarpae]|uniref:3-hydroxyacyl-CoA dehydrogenase n=1 Tax=Exilibacterium tricleocarpae TaxID=2591008 RepID=A0A545SXK0_9GAMM|nr:3-hydroxyacyl-CoA dehydrogenase NAD-binding domain-containing protein [Exilibacterium tricleocarpae]TQV69688.1 3-hydroxyacyl-CoA dehydrogenase [Exilibacterium tricleocarpae]